MPCSAFRRASSRLRRHCRDRAERGLGERIVSTVVAMKRLSRDEIEDYIASEEWRGKAGGYAIQGLAAAYVRQIIGSYSNVVGLPLFETNALLEGLAIGERRFAAPEPTMGIDEVLITALPGDRRAAALAGGQLLRLALDGGDEIRVGDIILGRINKVAASIGCAFVDLGRGPVGLLMRDDAAGGQRLAEGEAIICQVLREAIGEKGPKLTARLPRCPIRYEHRLGARAPSRLARGPDPVFGLLRDALAAGVARVVVDDGAELSRIRGALPELADRLEAWLEPAPCSPLLESTKRSTGRWRRR